MHIGACYAALGQLKEAKQQLQTALMAGVSICAQFAGFTSTRAQILVQEHKY